MANRSERFWGGSVSRIWDIFYRDGYPTLRIHREAGRATSSTWRVYMGRREGLVAQKNTLRAEGHGGHERHHVARISVRYVATHLRQSAFKSCQATVILVHFPRFDANRLMKSGMS